MVTTELSLDFNLDMIDYRILNLDLNFAIGLGLS